MEAALANHAREQGRGLGLALYAMSWPRNKRDLVNLCGRNTETGGAVGGNVKGHAAKVEAWAGALKNLRR